MEEKPVRKPMKRISRRKVCAFCQETVSYTHLTLPTT